MTVQPLERPAVPAAPAVATRVTAVVVTYNGRRYVEDCLRSLLADSAQVAIIVVDNASTDGTADFVERSFPAVQLIRLFRNFGYGQAANIGVSQAETEYIAILNQDVVALPGWTERLTAALDADPNIALATPKVLLRDDPARINTCGNTPHYSGITTCRGYGEPANRYRSLHEVPAISGAAVAARRSVFQALGGFDPLFFLYLEDTDLSLRAVLAGYRCVAVPEAEVLHQFEPSFSPEKLSYLERNRHLMLLKLYRWPTLLVLTPALLLAELTVLGYSLLRGPRCLAAKLSAYAWLAAHLPLAWRSRRQTQALRKVQDRSLLRRCSVNLDLAELNHPLGQAAMRLVNPLFRGWARLATVALSW